MAPVKRIKLATVAARADADIGAGTSTGTSSSAIRKPSRVSRVRRNARSRRLGSAVQAAPVRALRLDRFWVMVALASAVGICFFLAPSVDATRQVACGAACQSTTTETPLAADVKLDVLATPEASSSPRALLSFLTRPLFSRLDGTGSGPTEADKAAPLHPLKAAAPEVVPAPVQPVTVLPIVIQPVVEQPAAVQPVATAPVAAAPATPTVVGSGGINVISSNPISISNPITIKNPNVNHDINKVGAAGGALGSGPVGTGVKAGLLYGAANVVGAVGSLAGSLLGRRMS